MQRLRPACLTAKAHPNTVLDVCIFLIPRYETSQILFSIHIHNETSFLT